MKNILSSKINLIPENQILNVKGLHLIGEDIEDFNN